MLNEITDEKYPRFPRINKGCSYTNPSTESALKTSKLFEKGHSIEAIARMRLLKENTIEDHVIEIVSGNPKLSVSNPLSRMNRFNKY